MDANEVANPNPVASGRPGVLTAIAIVSIVFGSFGVLGGLASFAMAGFQAGAMAEFYKDQPWMQTYTSVMTIVGVIFSLLALVGGLAVLVRKPFGRRMIQAYTVYLIFSTLSGFFLWYQWTMPMTSKMLRSSSPPGQTPMPETAVNGVVVVMGVMTVAFSVLWTAAAVLVFIYLNRPSVVAYFSADSQSSQ